MDELKLVVYWTLREMREVVEGAKSKEDVLSTVDDLLINLSLKGKENLELVEKIKEKIKL